MNRLAPLSEEPTNDEEEDNNNSSKKVNSWRNWLKSHFSLLFNKKSDLKILLSVLGCPLFPISPHAGQPNTHVSPDLFPFFFLFKKNFSRENPLFLVRKSSFFLIWVVALLVGFVVGGVHNTAFHGGDRLPETGGQGEECVRHGKSEDGDGGRARVERLINRRWTHRSFAKGLLCDVADGSW